LRTRVTLHLLEIWLEVFSFASGKAEYYWVECKRDMIQGSFAMSWIPLKFKLI